MRVLILVMLAGLPALAAQSVDEDASRFLSEPHGRSGSLAPYRLVVEDLRGDTLEVASLSRGVRLERQVAVAGRERVEIILPVEISEHARIEVAGTSFTPRLPLRRVEPHYERSYAAVFSPDPVGARAVLPSRSEHLVCDYFEISDFFTDWRLLDGYDAVVVFNSADVRMPRGSQRAIAEFCSLGGAVFHAGAFRFSDSADDLPAPAEPQILPVRGVTLQRFGYGAGSIYRAGWNEFRSSRPAWHVVRDALLDHLQRGGDRAPGGEPSGRSTLPNPPLVAPLPPGEASPGLLFWGLAGGLLLLCLVAPMVARRFERPAAGTAAVLAGALVVGGLALLQDRPQPRLDRAVVVLEGGGTAASAATLLHVEEEWGHTMVVDLGDEAERGLPRRLPARPGWRAWVVYTPLVAPPADRGGVVHLRSGRVDGQTFRDYATLARRGGTAFSVEDAVLLEWWLEENAYRGREALIAPVELPVDAPTLAGTDVRDRGAIRVTEERAGR